MNNITPAPENATKKKKISNFKQMADTEWWYMSKDGEKTGPVSDCLGLPVRICTTFSAY
jgi:hypothetical protein